MIAGEKPLAVAYDEAKVIEAERQACEIRIRAERRAGELLREREKAKGAQSAPGKKGFQRQSDGSTTTAPTLSDLGISKQQSSNWQKLAAVPEETFEQELAQQERPTKRQYSTSISANHQSRNDPTQSRNAPTMLIFIDNSLVGSIIPGLNRAGDPGDWNTWAALAITRMRNSR